MTTQTIVKLSNSIRDAIVKIRPLYKNIQDEDDKIILSDVMSNLIQSQGYLSDIQLSYQQVLDDNETARKRIMQYEQWAEDLSKYKSFRLKSGCTIIIPKEPDSSPYSKEWYCKHCFDNKKKSLFQPELGTITFICPGCNKTIFVTDDELEEVQKFYGTPPSRPIKHIQVDPN